MEAVRRYQVSGRHLWVPAGSVIWVIIPPTVWERSILWKEGGGCEGGRVEEGSLSERKGLGRTLGDEYIQTYLTYCLSFVHTFHY